jgi:hypothetical protein
MESSMRFNRLACILTAALAPTVLLGCSEDEPDVLATKCESSCAVTSKMPPSCKAKQDECERVCKTLAQKAETGYFPGCGSCIADSFKWVYKEDAPCDKNPADPSCWCDYQKVDADPNSDKCKPKCYEPDGSVGY